MNKCATCQNCYTAQNGKPQTQGMPSRPTKYAPITNITPHITTACNLKCPYCFVYFDDFKPETMTRETAERMVDWLIKESRNERGLSIHFFGGEPFMAPGIMEHTIEYAKEQGMIWDKVFSFGATTNGTLLEDKALELVLKHKIKLLISLDGDRESHDKNRKYHNGTGSYDDIMENIRHIPPPMYDFRLTFTPETVGRLAANVIHLHKKYGKIPAPLPVFEVEWTDESWGIYERQLRILMDYVLDCQEKGVTVNIKQFQDAEQVIKLEKRIPTTCGRGVGGVGIDPRGNIYPCHRFTTNARIPNEYIIGTIDTGIEYERRAKLIEMDSSKIRSEAYDCMRCPARMRCAGHCLAVNFDMTGDSFTVAKNQCDFERINQRVGAELYCIRKNFGGGK